MYSVYILYSRSGKRYYIGQTENVENRLKRHNSKMVWSTAPYAPWELVLTITKASRSEAVILERKLKNLNSEDLVTFIRKYS